MNTLRPDDVPYWLGVGLIVVVLFFVALGKAARAQHSHERHHNDYLNWSSGKTANCCNNDDCGVLHDRDLRDSAAGAEVWIAGRWCPVLREHYLTRGKSPDWNAPHACIQKLNAHNVGAPPCSRLLCFAGKGGW